MPRAVALTTLIAPTRHRAAIRGVIGVLLVAHLPFFYWLISQVQHGGEGSLRALATGVVVALLGLRARDSMPAMPAQPDTHRAMAAGIVTAALSVAMAMAAWALTPTGWAFSAPVGCIACGLVAGGAQGVRRLATLGMLADLTYPWEIHLDRALNAPVQAVTAHASAWLLRITGLPSHVVIPLPGDDPHLMSPGLDVRVTALCAGFATLLALLSLGLVLAEAWRTPDYQPSWIVWTTPLVGFLGNIVRIAVSTHAAALWAPGFDGRGAPLNDGTLWSTAHDVIGYAAFAIIYGLLFWLLSRFTHAARRRA